jgi:cell fate regulator YaaT (PSP1 superfamily)
MSEESNSGGGGGSEGGGGGGSGRGRRRHSRWRRRKPQDGQQPQQPQQPQQAGGDQRSGPEGQAKEQPREERGRPSQPPRRGPERGDSRGRERDRDAPRERGERDGQQRRGGEAQGQGERRPQGFGRPSSQGRPRGEQRDPGQRNGRQQPGDPFSSRAPAPTGSADEANAPLADGEVFYAEPEDGGTWGRDEGDVGDGRPDYSTMKPEEIEHLKPYVANPDLLLDDLPDAPGDEAGTLMDVVGVKLYDAGIVADFDSQDLLFAQGDTIIVETPRGLALGEVVVPTTRRRKRNDKLPRAIRPATHNDMRQRERNAAKERAAFELCQQAISQLKLDMKLVRVDYLHGGNKAVFFFASEGRVDFRELVRELARRLHIRVEMRQIGVRDAARMLGGIGACGQRLCCNRYIREFQAVSIRMAKDQDLVLNPEKVSGLCGRLMCCLAHEDQVYREASRSMPRVGRRVMTPNGEGRVRDRDVLKRLVRVQLADEAGLVEFPADQVSSVGAVEKGPPAHEEEEVEPVGQVGPAGGEPGEGEEPSA